MTKLAKKVIEEHCLSISKDDPKTTYELSLKLIRSKNHGSSVRIRSIKSEHNVFICPKKLDRARAFGREMFKVSDEAIVRPKGTYGDILRLQEMLVNIRDPINLEADDGLFCDKCVNEDEKNFHKETPSLVLEDHLDPNIMFIFDLI
ncbi:13591_t:CDS:2 [Entrophospora sp. SA101]|nr:10175_t:CDS:2 [Entrophospora sp. SA101]CAJ0634132.1 8123_t:CDS:2 [Entrophospora sp. SA101]CAJ0749964.1 13591_t:CDS:2 [Entrophospora sp. SA101]CAJ0827093.1 10404_t:CDS:2 [Entrophospora sp. SA101]